MIVGFDLDDTLYRELDYVESGFRAVAAYVAQELGIDAAAALDSIHRSVRTHGRGRAFDDLLAEYDAMSVRRRDALVQVYRSHQPAIELPQESAAVLDELALRGHRLFLVTDGNANVQTRKIDALGIRSRFEHCYCTYRYGRAASKPATTVFELILRRTGAAGSDLVYVGDNPAKDFVGVRALGGRTIRVLTGNHARAQPEPGYAADVEVATIGDVPRVIEAWSS